MLETIAFGLLILSALLYGAWRIFRAKSDDDAEERKSKKRRKISYVGLYFWKPRGSLKSDAIFMSHSVVSVLWV